MAPDEPDDDDDDDDYVCSLCERNQHVRCRDLDCTCCSGNQ